MTKEELEIVALLGDVWNLFLKLPPIGKVGASPTDNDAREFIVAIHTAQNIVLSRDGLRWIEKMLVETEKRKKEKENGG
jgi:hypothetical protein